MTPKFRLLVLTLCGVAVASIAHTLLAFSLVDRRWSAGQIDMEMQLGSAGGLIDGSADWNECGIAALVDWNEHLDGTGVSFNAVRGSTRTPAGNDGFNSVFFSDDLFGTPFDKHVLAATTAWYFSRKGVDETVEADVVFNNAQAFNCYRGDRRLVPTPESSDTSDLRRVGNHEFGHVLGLGHPDEATPPQVVDAIMNSFIGDRDSLALDDIQGALTLYGVAVIGIPFPPRSEVLEFYLDLENEYRDTLGREQNNPGNVNAVGSAVWLPEFLRYVLNDCSAEDATARVLLNIETGSTQPVCGVVDSGVINFPPRNLSFDFMNTLDTYYRDELNETAPDSYVNLEGKAVWLEVYLGYRVNGCNNREATARVFQIIRGGGTAPICT